MKRLKCPLGVSTLFRRVMVSRILIEACEGGRREGL
jgi:hypothetical protein